MLRDQIDVVIIVVLSKLDLFKVRCGMQIYLCVHGFAVLKSHYQTIGFLSAERTHLPLPPARSTTISSEQICTKPWNFLLFKNLSGA